MASEPKEFVIPVRTGRMKGVMITIDGDTWIHTLRQAGIPIDTPLSLLPVKRWSAKGGRIILKVTLAKKDTDIAINPITPKKGLKRRFVTQTEG